MTKRYTFTNAKLRGHNFSSAPPGCLICSRTYVCAIHGRSTSEISGDTPYEVRAGCVQFECACWRKGCLRNPKGMIEHGSAVTYNSPLSPPFIRVISFARFRAHFLNSTRLFHYHTLLPGILSSINSRGCSRIAVKSYRVLPGKGDGKG